MIFTRPSLKVLYVLGAPFVGQLVPWSGPWNDITVFCKNAVAGLQEDTRVSVFLFENDSIGALKG